MRFLTRHQFPASDPMSKPKPSAEVEIGHELLLTMLKEFLPEFAEEQIEYVGAGWDNEIHRVGADHAIRMPRRKAAARLIENEQRWLPELAPILPLPIPAPIFAGHGAFGYPWAWSLVPWFPGVPLAHSPALDQAQLIDDLSNFLNSLHVPAHEDAPSNEFRGVPLAERDKGLRRNLANTEGVDSEAVLELWESLVDGPAWGGEPIWLHGDLHPLNLLVRSGRLSAVIDFGDVTSGDPACDIAVAWMLFDDEGRSAFRTALRIDGRSVDIHTWNRARAWALSLAVAYLANSADEPTMSRIGHTTLRQVLA